MFASLIAVVFALVLGHVAPRMVTRARRYEWFDRWLEWLGAKSGPGGVFRGKYGVAFAVSPVWVVALLQWGLQLPWLGLLGFLFGLLTLVYTWGPRDLDVDVESVLDATQPQARREAVSRLWAGEEAAGSDGSALVDAVFLGALRRWFGVLFWFLLLGPFGALLYRLVSLCAGELSSRLPEATLAGARKLRSLLEWPVAQLMGISLALVGNFDAVWQAWRSESLWQLPPDPQALTAAGRASVRSELAEEAADYEIEGMVPQLRELPELRDAMSLVWRILLLWLVLLAIFVIAGWVG